MAKQLAQPEHIKDRGWYVGTAYEEKGDSYYLHNDGKLYDTTYCPIINEYSGYYKSYDAAMNQRCKYYDQHGLDDMHPVDYTNNDSGSRALDLEA